MGQTTSEQEEPSQNSSDGDVQDSPYEETNTGGDTTDVRQKEDDEEFPGPGSPYRGSPPPTSLTNMVKPILQDEPPLLPQPAPKPVETVATQFKWTAGGEEVFVTGSFNDWQGKVRMNRNEAGEFLVVLNITPGIHQYKFIVDEEWRLNPDCPTVEDQGVTNNIIEVKRTYFEDVAMPFLDSDDEEEYDDEIGRAVQQECRDRSRMPSSA
eukprot:TRINITY_DN8148_c0_g1_i6.p1 TRINITY_DN8148_c0_g1~~TRINITY_DN8148_c0_g1_i6.p1  ORF type:complete len:210 (+),score=29.83 TRINITY_DN8148_c0_g1_i6:118-747(+)